MVILEYESWHLITISAFILRDLVLVVFMDQQPPVKVSSTRNKTQMDSHGTMDSNCQFENVKPTKYNPNEN